MKDNIKNNLIIKFITFIFFIWIYQKYEDEFSISKGLENNCNSKDSLYIAEYRLLSEQDLRTGSLYRKIEDILLKYRDNELSRFDSYGSLEYDNSQKSCPNDLNIYKKRFKRKYPTKKGFKKLDFYCEQIIFDTIDRMRENQAGASRYSMKLKENIFRKWGKIAAVTCLIPLIGIILPVLQLILGKGVIPTSVYTLYYGVVFIIFTYIILFSVMYIMSKVVKYEKLEAGRGKLNFNECCKDVFLRNRYY